MIELIEKADNDDVELPPSATDRMSQEQIQSMLAQTMKQIETRKKQVQEAVRNRVHIHSLVWYTAYNEESLYCVEKLTYKFISFVH